MPRKFIPIIGTISAGKSTFLDGLLGIDSLQTGVLTTTKFVCLIQNSPNISFYHVIPKRANGISLQKDGKEINDKNEIIEKIKQINQEFENKTVTSDDLFYMLETPIKNIKNEALLENCYFMDIPGLNEHGASYIDNIFSVILDEDILFEIIVFDAKAIGQQNIIDIFQNLENKKVLKKENNMYILNKIDKYTKGEDPVEAFQHFFYHTFEDEKIEQKITINFNKNFFIPMNSILYQAETKYETDFYSMLLKELFIYLDTVNKATSESFSDCLEKRVECIIKQNNIDSDMIDEELDNIKKNDKEIIKKSVNDIKNLTGINTSQETSFELNLSNNEIKKTLYKLFIIHKKQLNKSFSFSNSYYEIEDAINSYFNELDSAPPLAIQEKEDIKKKKSLELLLELNQFIQYHLKGQFDSLNRSLNQIIENLVERKIRLSFIGNISVGKSTVLNCIIGDNLLPSKDAECTYRGIIIKYRDIPKPQLYRAQMKVICAGTGSDYYKFDEVEFYCDGSDKIKAYLNNKNNDKNFNEKDMFIVIHAKLKVFDFIKLDEKYLKKIEFVDLPGHNRKENNFINKIGDGFSPYDRILKFTNSCIFINQHDSIDDDDSVKRLQAEYVRNKEKLDIKLQSKSLETCIFLINKIDELSKDNKENEKNKIRGKIFKILGEVEKNIPKNWDNISFFSGKSFKEYLSFYTNFVEKIDNEPIELLEDLHKELSNKFFFSKNYKNFVIKRIGEIQEKLELNSQNNEDSDDEDEKKIQVPSQFNETMKKAFHEFRQKLKTKINANEEKEIIEKIYLLYYQIKNKDFSNTNFSQLFFQKIKEIIIISDNIQNEILKIEMDNFFQNADKLFNRNIENEKAAKENEKNNIRKQYELFKNNVIPKIQNYLNQKQTKIRGIIANTKSKCLDLISDEIDHAEQRLKDAGKDPAKASSILEEKIKEEFNKMVSIQTEETKTILNDIFKLSNKAIETHYQQSDLSESEISVMKQKSFGIVKTLLTGALGGASAGVGLAVLGSSVMASVAAGTLSTTAMTTLAGSFFGPMGIVAGLTVGGIISGIGFLVGALTRKKKYIKAMEETKSSVSQKFDDIDSAFVSNFESFKNNLIKELNVKNEVELKGIDHMKIPDWNKMIQEYKVRKEDIQAKLKEEINKTF